MLKPPLPYSPDVETLDPKEHTASLGLIETFDTIVHTTHNDHGEAQRGVHAKSHALLEGELVVHADLVAPLAQGIFREPGRIYPVLIRLSAIPGDPIRDSVSLPRGFSFKVIGVDGERLPGSEGEVTQDFVLASGPVFPAPTPEKFLQNLKLLAASTDKAEGAKAFLSKILQPVEQALEAVGLESTKVKAFGGYPAVHPLGDRYFSQAPFRHGDYVVKYDLVPESENFRRLTDEPIDLERGENAIRDLLAGVFATEGGAWTLRAQFYRDPEANPIEDAGTEWKEEDSPFLALATLRVGPQASWTEARSRVVDGQTAFRPWHGIKAHQPLGSINRARREVYPAAQELRSRLNRCPLHEPNRPPALD